MYRKLEGYTKLTIDYTLGMQTDKTIYDQDRNEFVFISMIGFNTITKDVIKVINTRKARERVYASLNGWKWGYTSSDKYKTLSKKTANSDYIHTILYQDDKVVIDQTKEEYRLYLYLNKDENLEDKIYEKLKKYSSVPLLEEWKTYIKGQLLLNKSITELTIFGTKDDMQAYKLYCNKQVLIDIISD